MFPASALGLAYKNLGDTSQAIIYFEQARTIDSNASNIDGIARHSFNLAGLYAQQGKPTLALSLAQEATNLWTRIDSPNKQRSQELVAQLLGNQ